MKHEKIQTVMETTRETTAFFIRLGQGITGYIRHKTKELLNDTGKKTIDLAEIGYQCTIIAGIGAMYGLHQLLKLTEGVQTMEDLIDMNEIIKDQKEEKQDGEYCELVHYDFERMSGQFKDLNGEK